VCMTDPIADLLTRIRNALRIEKPAVTVPFSNMKKNILQVLKNAGYIADFNSEMQEKRAVLRVDLKYGPDGEQVITSLKRISKPGRRVYSRCGDLKEPLHGLGVAVVSTPRGVLPHTEAKKQKVGGEILFEVY